MNMPVPSLGIVYLMVLPLAWVQTATASQPIADTVTKIAARFGVWDFSLFARNYRALYGEAPSQTLRKPRDRANALREDEGMTPTWIAFAARQFALQQPMQGAGETPMRMAES